jgi:hypothetical protein
MLLFFKRSITPFARENGAALLFFYNVLCLFLVTRHAGSSQSTGAACMLVSPPVD